MWAIGDIHGQASALKRIIEIIDGEPFITLGDVIDRGPNNLEAVGIVLEKASFCIKGNHEELMERAIFPDEFATSFKINNDQKLWLHPQTGGSKTYAELMINPSYKDILSLYLAKCIPFYDDGKNLLTHGGLVDPEIIYPTWSGQPESHKQGVYNAMMWTREHQLSLMIANQIKRRLIVGHTQINELTNPCIVDSMIFMDTGAANGGNLSAINIETSQVISVPCGV